MAAFAAAASRGLGADVVILRVLFLVWRDA